MSVENLIAAIKAEGQKQKPVQLSRLETLIEQAKQEFIIFRKSDPRRLVLGKILNEIREELDSRLKFNEICLKEFSYGASYCYQLIQCTRVAEIAEGEIKQEFSLDDWTDRKLTFAGLCAPLIHYLDNPKTVKKIFDDAVYIARCDDRQELITEDIEKAIDDYRSKHAPKEEAAQRPTEEPQQAEAPKPEEEEEEKAKPKRKAVQLELCGAIEAVRSQLSVIVSVIKEANMVKQEDILSIKDALKQALAEIESLEVRK